MSTAAHLLRWSGRSAPRSGVGGGELPAGREERLFDPRAPEVCRPEIGAEQVGVCEVCSTEIRAEQQHPPKVCGAQVEPVQVGADEITAPAQAVDIAAQPSRSGDGTNLVQHSADPTPAGSGVPGHDGGRIRSGEPNELPAQLPDALQE